MNKRFVQLSFLPFLVSIWLPLALLVSPSAYGEMTDQEIVAAGVIGPNGVQRMKAIIRGVMGGDPAELNESSKQELQTLFKRLAAEDNMSHSEFQEFSRFLRERFTGLATEMMPLFWEDALWAYRKQEFFKSTMREKVEEKYLNYGIVSQARIDQNDELILKIANRTPLSVQGIEVIVDENFIELTLENMEHAKQRVEWLFSFE
ncbi:hypothetical protein OAV24_02360 [Gammaproteobacteria bacterium]|jgi:hypothetical protein|nr:hypothetical protein [Gammaproteobacteria bacterium]